MNDKSKFKQIPNTTESLAGDSEQGTTNAMIDQRLDYIHNNPVEAGFVLEPESWHWGSARDYMKKDMLICFMYDLRAEALLILGRRIAALNLRPGGWRL